MDSIFCKLKKAQKTRIKIFASLKKLKKHEFDFLQDYTRKAQKHGFNFLQAQKT